MQFQGKKKDKNKQKSHKSLFESLSKNTWKHMEVPWPATKEDKCCFFMIAKKPFANRVTRR